MHTMGIVTFIDTLILETQHEKCLPVNKLFSVNKCII